MMTTPYPRWESNLTLEFVRSYLKYECLWNPKHQDYRNRKKNEEAYNLVISDLKDFVKLDINKVKHKIRSLRTTYCQEVTKILRRSADPDNIYESNLIWFRLMDDCLKDIVSPRLSMQLQRQTPDWFDTWEDESSNDSDLITDNKGDFETADPIKIREPVSNKTNTDHKNTSIFSVVKTDSQIQEDEYDLFGKYVAVQLRKLQLKSALKAKAEILRILSEALLAD